MNWLVLMERTPLRSSIALRSREDPSKVIRIQDRGTERDGSISPDGRWLLYSSIPATRREVLVRSVPKEAGGPPNAVLFRSDLYYRLKVFPIMMPPLRDHAEDIPIPARYFTKKYAAKMDRAIDKIPSETMKALVRWSWPENVRELENFIERSVILSRGPSLRAPLAELWADAPETGSSTTLEDVERDHILRVFRETGGVISAAANRLGVPRATLNAIMKKLGISRSDL
jgi:transcriptional regulator with AAA-type ATPase domain